VGHFAKYAEERISQSDPEKMAQQLAGSSAEKIVSKTEEVIKEAQRVYDAPDKGVVWGWEVSAYVWTKAIATGAFLVPFLATAFGLTPVRDITQWLGISFGLIFLAITGGLLIKDLDKPARFAYILLRPQWRSWLVRGGYAIGIYGGLLTLCGAAKLFGWTNILTPVTWGSAIFAIITAVYTAFLFAQAKGRDFWQSPALSLHMLVHAVMAGAAIFALLSLFMVSSESWLGFLRTLFYCSIAFNLLVITIEMLTAHPTADSKRVVKMIVSGQFSGPFWIGTLIVGNLLPVLLIWLGGSAFFAAGGVLVLIGVYITEHIWVRAPQLIPLS
jgi:formate-dependent nitrite reductase membrane component NrfD